MWRSSGVCDWSRIRLRSWSKEFRYSCRAACCRSARAAASAARWNCRAAVVNQLSPVPDRSGTGESWFTTAARQFQRAADAAARAERQQAARQEYLNSLLQERNRILDQSQTPLERHMATEYFRRFQLIQGPLLAVPFEAVFYQRPTG